MVSLDKKSILFLIISILSLLILIFFIIFPAMSDIKKIATDLNNQKEKLQVKSSLGQNIDKNIKELNKIKKSNKISESFILPEKDLLFIETLEKIGSDLNMKQTITLDESQIKNTKIDDQININIKLTGDYKSFLNYLYKIETNKYYIKINSINIKSNNKIIQKRI